MQHLLNNLCTPNAAARRQALRDFLSQEFPGRHRIESRTWGAGLEASDTVNHLLVFGQEGGHLVVGAHYDAVPGSPGANDNAAAVVQILAAAKRLHDQVEQGVPAPDITFCLWDHEEHFGSRIMGSRTYLEAHLQALPAKAVVFDVSGIGELYVSGRDHAGVAQGLPSRQTPPSDNRILLEAGIPATLICALPPEELNQSFPSTWYTLHTPRDTPDKVEQRTLMAGAELILDMAQGFRAA